jgi:hypothetical protein
MNENQFIFIFGKSKYHSLYNQYYYPISFNNFQKFSSKIKYKFLNPIKKETNSIMNFQYNSKLIKNNSVKNILKPINKENLLINNLNKNINENKINNNNNSFNVGQNKKNKIFDELENNLNFVKLKILKKNKINNNINNESKTGSTRTTDYDNISFILKNKNNNNNVINRNICTNKKDLIINNKIHNKEIKFISLPKIKINKYHNFSKMFSLIKKYNKLKFEPNNLNSSFNDINYF